MTGKEAFDLIATNCAMNCKKTYHEKCSENCEVLKAFQVVKKDLEILDLLKKFLNILINPNSDENGLSKEETDKLDRWLENDKIR